MLILSGDEGWTVTNGIGAAALGGEDLAIAAGEARRVARGILIDTWTAEVVTALHERGIRPLLLKGPATACWLYADEPWARTYVDIDLLVAPTDFAGAEAALRRIGFQQPIDPAGLVWHAWTWVRPFDGAKVDLHLTLHCLEHLPAAQVWAEVSRDAETCDIRGVAVAIPGIVARTLQVALHVDAAEDQGSKPAEDLRRALAQVDRDTWSAAADVARRLGVAPAMGARLRQTQDGRRLADELGLPEGGVIRDHLLADIAESRTSPRAYLLWCLTSQTTYRARARWIIQREVPPRRYMRELYPLARKGDLGLVAAYGLRMGRDVVRLPGAVLGWIRFTRRMKGDPTARR